MEKYLKRNKFNLVISIGEDCGDSMYLIDFNLRKNSYPFDWLTHATFKTRIDLILNDFNDFLIKENLVFLEKNPNALQHDLEHDYYHDLKTDFYFYHDFPFGVPFEESYDEVYSKYKRRIKRLYNKVKEADSVLFVFLARGARISVEEAKEAIKKLRKKFRGTDIHLLILQNTPEQEIIEKERYINNRLTILRYDTMKCDPSKNEDTTKGNFRLNNKVFETIKLSKTTRRKCLVKPFYNIFIKIPTGLFIRDKEKRRQLRRKYEKVFYGIKEEV